MALIDKIFSLKGNRQFNEAEDKLIDALNDTNFFIADEAYINFNHTELFAIDKEERKFLKITYSDNEAKRQFLDFDSVLSYQTEIKDRANQEWMEDFSKWKTQKKFIRSICITIISEERNMELFFSQSENKDGDKVSSIKIKRALFSMEKWDEVLFNILDKSDE